MLSFLPRFQSLNSLNTAAELVKSQTANQGHCHCQVHLSCPRYFLAYSSTTLLYGCWGRLGSLVSFPYLHPFCQVTEYCTCPRGSDLLFLRSLRVSVNTYVRLLYHVVFASFSRSFRTHSRSKTANQLNGVKILLQLCAKKTDLQ